MSDNPILDYLDSKNLTYKVANENNVHLPCFFHGEEESDRGRLYINIDPEQNPQGLFCCFVCSESGALNKIRRHFGDPPVDSDSPKALDERSLTILDVAADYYHSRLGESPEAYKYLKTVRGLTFDTIKKFRLGWADGGLVTHLVQKGFDIEEIKKTGLVDGFGGDFLVDRITIPYTVLDQVVQIRGKDIEGKYVTPPGQKARLFNHDTVFFDPGDTAVICEGEFDAMVLTQLGFVAVGVPGANNWNDSWTPLFDDIRRVFICFDADRAGQAGAEKLALKLGSKGRIVVLPDGMDVSDWYQEGKNKEDFDYLFSKSAGGLLVSVRQAAERWLEIEGNPNLTGLRFNVRNLDDAMRHGLTPGQILTLIAKTNCLSGDTDMVINRGGAAKHYSLREIVERFPEWSRSVNPPMTQRLAEDGTIRLVRIKNAWSSGVKPVYRVITEGGRQIDSTMDHRFLTPSGYHRLSELVVGDEVVVKPVHGERGGADKVVSISFLGEQETFDIEVENDPHNFVANGFVVHNSGKTLMSLNLFHRMKLIKPDIKILFLSLEQTRNEWFERARRIQSFYDPSIDITSIEDTVTFWEKNLYIVDKNRMTESEVMQAIDQYTYDVGEPPDLTCLDYLGYYSRSFKGEAYERTTSAIMGLKNIGKETGTVLYAPHQVNRTGSFGKELAADMAKESGAVEETSDMMLAIWNPDQQPGKTVHDQSGEIHMKILKSRDGPVGQEVVFKFAPRTLAIVPTSDPLVEKVKMERTFANNADTWEMVVYRFRTGDMAYDLTHEAALEYFDQCKKGVAHGMG